MFMHSALNVFNMNSCSQCV